MHCEYYRASNVNKRQGDGCQLSSVYEAIGFVLLQDSVSTKELTLTMKTRSCVDCLPG